MRVSRELKLALYLTFVLGSMLYGIKEPFNTRLIEDANSIQNETNNESLIENIKDEIDTKSDVTEPHQDYQEKVITWEDKYTREEMILLAALVYAEARNCNDEHQQMVARVVLNRVESDDFPDTIEEVIYQDKPVLQYACVENGQLQTALDYYNGKEIPDEYTSMVLENCLENVYGVAIENIEESQEYKNIVYQSEFIQGSSVAFKIGNTYFCYK